MQIEREDLNPCTIKLSVTCAPEQVKSGFDKAYKGFAKRMRVPGFRPGHAPKSILEGLIDKNDLYNAAADFIVRSALKDALDAEKIKPHEAPSVDVTELKEEENVCRFWAKVPLEPKVELGEYKKVTINAPKLDVPDDELDKTLDELRKSSGKREDVTDRGIQEGDMCVINVKLVDGDGDGKNFMSVAGQTFAALDKAIIGMQVEELKVVDLTFPKGFHDKELAGKKGKTQITIRSVSSMRMPELNDAFAQEGVGKTLKSENLEELKSKLRERMLEAKKAMREEFVNEAIQIEVLKNSKVDVPDTMWETVANQRLREIAAEAQQQGKKMEQVAEEAGLTIEELVEKWQAEAKTQVQRAVVANTIFRNEGLKLANEDYNHTILAMSREYNTDPNTLMAYLKKNNGLYEVQVRAVYRKTMDFLRSHATINEE